MADGIFLAYETEGTHLRVFIVQVVSILALALLPDKINALWRSVRGV